MDEDAKAPTSLKTTDEALIALFKKADLLGRRATEAKDKSRHHVFRIHKTGQPRLNLIVAKAKLTLDKAQKALVALQAQRALIPADLPEKWQGDRNWLNSLCASLSRELKTHEDLLNKLSSGT